MSDTPQGADWWRANDGKWYPPDLSKLPDPPLPEGQWRASKGPSKEQVAMVIFVGGGVLFAAFVYLGRWFGRL